MRRIERNFASVANQLHDANERNVKLLSAARDVVNAWQDHANDYELALAIDRLDAAATDRIFDTGEKKDVENG